MDLFRILYMKKTGEILPDASLPEILFSKANGTTTKTIDWTPTISVNDAVAGNALDYQCKITAVQTGSGDPTPTNIRPISGFTGASISVNGSTVSVSWQTEAGTVYGGVLDVTTGTLTVTQVGFLYDGSDDENWGIINLPLNVFGVTGLTGYDSADMCDSYKMIARGSSSGLADLECRLASSRATFMVRNTNYATLDAFKSSLTLSPITVVYTLLTPISYTLTPTEITLAEGANTIWADCGDSKLTYLAKK